jgi:flavin-dependent dehydrogenase
MNEIERLQADCVIVGAGPAGATSALLLARAGFDVLLIDRAVFPRRKPCGDSISPQANLLLERLGVLAAIEAAHPARLQGWRITAPSGGSFEARFADVVSDQRITTGLALTRDKFDAVLLDAARAAGARVLTGVAVEDVLRANGSVVGVRARRGADTIEVSAPLTVGADGLQSVVRRKLHLLARKPRLRKVALTAHVTSPLDVSDYGELHVLDDACVGISAVEESRAVSNVTLVLAAERYGRTVAGKSFESFWAHVNRFPRLRGRFAQCKPVDDLMASGPFDQPTRAAVVPGAALVGDAAGYFDPFTGQGIYQALAGGMLLADAAAAALQSGRVHEPLHDYARDLTALVNAPRRVQRGIELVLARPRLADRCINALAHAPSAASALIAVTGDVKPPRSLLSAEPLITFLRHFARSAA